MPWHVPIGLTILTGFLLQPYLIKKNVASGSHTRKLRMQYFFCALLAGGVATIRRDLVRIDALFLQILLIGILNSFACYCHWRAVDLSLSKTSLFTQADDLIALFLGYLFLRETKLLTPVSAVGVVLCVSAATAYALVSRKAKKGSPEEAKTNKRGLLFWVLLYSVIWGVATFAFRYYAIHGMSIPTFIFAWYGGSFLGSLIVFSWIGKAEAGSPLDRTSVRIVATLASVVCCSTTLSVWGSHLAPITITQPILQISEMIFPTVIGLWVFKEASDLNPTIKALMFVGFVGGIILAVSY